MNVGILSNETTSAATRRKCNNLSAENLARDGIDHRIEDTNIFKNRLGVMAEEV